jgi:hypothetical protein
VPDEFTWPTRCAAPPAEAAPCELAVDSWAEDADKGRVIETSVTVVTPLALRYPNGRYHETTLIRELHPGEQFEIYGRTWTAVLKQARRRPRTPDIARVVCVLVETTTAA